MNDDDSAFGRFVQCGLKASEECRKEQRDKRIARVALFMLICAALAFIVWWGWPAALGFINSRLSR